MPDANILDAFKAVGTVLTVAQYVVPAIQIITTGLTILRLGRDLFLGSPRIPSHEEQILLQIGDFLILSASPFISSLKIFIIAWIETIRNF